MRLTSFAVICSLVLFITQVAGQAIEDPNCPQEIQDQIQTCLDTVTSDEGKSPCSSSDWPCICNVQQGLIACHTPCPASQDPKDITYNDQNCKGQNGYANAAGGDQSNQYKGSTLTTTGGPGPGEQTAGPTSTSTTSTASASATATTTTSSSSTTATGTGTQSTSRPTGTARPTSSPTPGGSGQSSSAIALPPLVISLTFALMGCAALFIL